MATSLEDLRVLRVAEEVADALWRQVIGWDSFAKHSLGSQFVRAADSIGANIAESFGRFGYGEKLQFLYYAPGSLFETKFWLNRALTRGLIAPEQAAMYGQRLTDLGRCLNAFANSLRSQRSQRHDNESGKSAREPLAIYHVEGVISTDSLFTEQELLWLSNAEQSLISNL